MADKERELQLKISAQTQGVKQGMDSVRSDLQQLESATKGWGKSLDIAAHSLDVKPMRQVNAEVSKLRAEYKRLADSGQLSQQELAQAAGNLKTKTAQLRGQQSTLNTTMRDGHGVTGRLAGNVKNLVGAYLGFQAVSGIMRSVVSATKEAEQSQYALQASITAAQREFDDISGLESWQQQIADMSEELRIYSQSSLKNAAAQTMDMTKRLGLEEQQMQALIQRTADLSAGKTSLESGIERVTAALRGEAESAEMLGLTLNADYIKSWYEANNATGKAWESLTQVEQAQVRYNALMEQSAAVQGRAAGSVETFSGALQMVQARLADAVANNDELSDAMTRLAGILTDNADEIADLATALTDTLGTLTNWTLEHKELLGVLLGSGGLLMALSKTAGAISNVGGALKTASRVPTPEVLSSAGKINAALVSRFGLYSALAATIVKTAQAYQGMRDAQEQARDAAERLALQQAENQGIAEAAADSTGLEIENIRELNRLIREGVVVRDELTGQYQTTAQAQREAATQAQREAAAAQRRQESWQAWRQEMAQLEQKYGDVNDIVADSIPRQQWLNEAVQASTNTHADLEQQVKQTADSYIQARNNLRILNREHDREPEVVKKAQDEMLQARKAYSQAVQRLRQQEYDAAQDQYDRQRDALRRSLRQRQIAIEEDLIEERKTQAEANEDKAEAELEYWRQVLEIRQQAVKDAAKIYGEDSDQYRKALEEKKDAELMARDMALDLEKAEQRVGEAGAEAGRRGAAGMRQIGDAAQQQTEKVKSLGERLQGFAKGFYGQWDAIQNKINSIDTMEGLREFHSQNREALYNQGMQSMFSSALNRGALDAYYERLNELQRQAQNASSQSPALQAQAATGSAKTMTLRLQSPSGETVSGQFAESDASRVLQVLKQAGMQTT